MTPERTIPALIVINGKTKAMTRQQAAFFTDNGNDAYDDELFDEIEAGPDVDPETGEEL